jgi:hypothetical protein
MTSGGEWGGFGWRSDHCDVTIYIPVGGDQSDRIVGILRDDFASV